MVRLAQTLGRRILAMAATVSAHAYVDFIRLMSPELWPVFERINETIFLSHPHAHVVGWPKQKILSFGFGPRKLSQHYLYISIRRKYLNLGFYNGSTINDPTKLLEGNGKKLRHVKLRTVEDSLSPPVLALIHDAILNFHAHPKTAA